MLDSKAPKSEDIDEEDDDVPGRHIHMYLFTYCINISIHAFKYLALGMIEYGVGNFISVVEETKPMSVFESFSISILSF